MWWGVVRRLQQRNLSQINTHLCPERVRRFADHRVDAGTPSRVGNRRPVGSSLWLWPLMTLHFGLVFNGQSLGVVFRQLFRRQGAIRVGEKTPCSSAKAPRFGLIWLEG